MAKPELFGWGKDGGGVHGAAPLYSACPATSASAKRRSQCRECRNQGLSSGFPFNIADWMYFLVLVLELLVREWVENFTALPSVSRVRWAIGC